jgi:hypothetical protein
MKANVGSVDKSIRILVGIGLLAWAWMGESGIHWLGLLGVVPILTALVGSCPLYSMLGIRTCPAPRQ